MNKIFRFKLNKELVKLAQNDCEYTCIIDFEEEIGFIYWVSEERELETDTFDLEDIKTNIYDGYWIICN